MKKVGIIVLTALFCLSGALPILAAESGQKHKTKTTKTAKASKQSSKSKAKRVAQAKTSRVTHAEVARMLVDLLGLSRFLPANPTVQETFGILMQNKVAPPDGWVTDAVVTKGDLAVLLVKALRAMGEDIDIDVDNTKQAMQWLRQEGIPIDTIGQGVSVLGPLAQPVAGNVFDPTTDPVSRRDRFSSTDEQESGADADRVTRGVEVAATREEVAVVIQAVPRPKPKKPKPTPSQPQIPFFPGT